MKKYTVIHHFNYPPCLHHSSTSHKAYLSCSEEWIEVPWDCMTLDDIEIIDPLKLELEELKKIKISPKEWDILKWWAK